jgi:UDP-N-acetylmuramoyl-L-alanyl-D-glutamate--2,6-diaminopimelate ligase
MKEFLRKVVPTFLIDRYHGILAFLGAVFFRFPSKNLKVIGVTGTNGKSTVVNLISLILKEAGFNVASTSSVEFKIKDKAIFNTLRMTMPGGFYLNKLLREAVNRGCQYAVLEITSEGIKQYRHKFINFEIVALTNLTPEHIEAHGGFENYKAAKGKLFQTTKGVHVINLDDEYKDYFLGFSAEEKMGYGIENGFSETEVQRITAKNTRVTEKGVRFLVGDTEFNLNLLGRFNIYNALAAISIALSQGISLEVCRDALKKAKVVPGRMEEVISEPFKVIVDYAFTPNALEKVYQTINDNFKPKKTICVLGSCGGGRDKWKRPVLGGLAAKYCQEVIVTNEDPYDEDPIEIIDQVAQGAGVKVRKILDRREAINAALRLAETGSLVIITGKGCEPSICLAGGRKIPWDDRQTVREEFKKIISK